MLYRLSVFCSKPTYMKKTTVLLCLFLAIGSLGAFTQAQSKSTLLKKSIGFGKAKDIRTDIYFFAGELNINTSTDELAECFYGYVNGFLKPMMTYSEVGKVGYLSIKSEEENKGLHLDENNNKWNLNLNRNIKNDISIKLRAGKANINLEESKLNVFEYKMTAGESNINLRNTSVAQVRFNLLAGKANIDLSGKWHNDGVAEIKGGVGEITVIVPYNTGVRITASGVLGEVNIPFFHRNGNIYTNDSFEKTRNTIFLNISGGIGQINVKMAE